MSANNLESQRRNRLDTELNHKKMDIVFYDAINNLKQHHVYLTVYHFLLGLIFIIFIPIDYGSIKQPNDKNIRTAMILALIASILQSFLNLAIRLTTLRNNSMILRLSVEMRHSTDQPITSSIRKLQNCVSQTMYNVQNETLISNEGLTQRMKKIYSNILEANIKQKLFRQSPCISCFIRLADLFGFAVMIYAIVALASGQKNTPQLVLLIIYIILEGFSKIVGILILLLIALSPILCIVGCFIICLCFKDDGSQTYKLPEQQKASQQMITETGGTCPICYQNFIVDQNVIRLRCSPKHMFHPLCISGWTKINAVCPICRTSIGTGQNLQQQ